LKVLEGIHYMHKDQGSFSDLHIMEGKAPGEEGRKYKEQRAFLLAYRMH
jgi:hypothetical protein